MTSCTGTCLIIAAGMGTRMAHRSDSKPLLEVGGYALIERVIMTASDAGLTHFVIVTGHHGECLQTFLHKVAVTVGVDIEFVQNDEWKRANGLSVYSAHVRLNKPFFLLMSDHLFDPEIIRTMNHSRPPEGGLLLGVDRNLDNPLIDLDDVTRVHSEHGHVRHIGKQLREYDAFDTGIFLCTPGLFDALQSSMEQGDDSLSGGVYQLAEKGLAHVHDIEGRFWLDVDDEAAFHKATAVLRENDLPVKIVTEPAAVT
ncbi:MAG: NTP transferase domain-containing protein [Gammaproteobacteria bacterium]|nr:NTP transferase domain-containing protein [Gammaproteobacteria bacterium]